MNTDRRAHYLCSFVFICGLTTSVVSFAQDSPHVEGDPARGLLARYEDRYELHPWWDPRSRTVLSPTKDYDNASGKLRILNQSGELQTKDHAFFTALGSNGRACVTCHQPANAMSLSVDLVRSRWLETDGKDPV